MVDLLSKKDIRYQAVQALGTQGGTAFFFISLAVFFILLASYGGIYFLNQSQKDALAKIQRGNKDKEDEIKSNIEQIFALDQRLKNIRMLTSGHLFPSNVIKFVEKNTLSQVRFGNFNYDAPTNKLDMTGDARSYAIIARQVHILESDPNVERVEFGGLSLTTTQTGDGLAGFKVTVVFKKSFITLRQ